MPQKLLLSSVVLIAAAGLCACNRASQAASETTTPPQGPAIIQPGAPGQASTAISSVPTYQDNNFTDGDVKFMQGMIHHHNQALLMAAMIPTHTKSPELQVIGQKIQLSQSGEMKQMTEWLTSRKQTVPTIAADGSVKMEMAGMAGHMMDMSAMPGMLTADQMKALDKARGAVFDELFLTGMIMHHKGALTMVADLREAGGGKEPNIGHFLDGVDNDQRMEIVRMYALLGRPVEWK
jgi:uncharacterized protein (DUF305 family)